MIKFHIKPLNLTLSYFDGKKNYQRFTVNSKEAFIRCIKRNLANSGRVSGEINFDCELDLQNNFFDLGDACDALRAFYMAHSELEAFDYLIDAFDNSILKELKKTIDDLVGVIYGSIIKEHEIVLRSTDTSNEILAKLLDEIFGLESIKKLLQKLNELCNQRLNLIQKEFFLKS